MALGAGLTHTHHRVTLGRSLPFCALLSSPVNRVMTRLLGQVLELVDCALSIVPGPDWVPNSVILHSWKQGLWHPRPCRTLRGGAVSLPC